MRWPALIVFLCAFSSFFIVLPSYYSLVKAQCAPGHTYYSCTITCSWPNGSSFPAWGGYCYDPNGVGSSCDATCPAYTTPYSTPYSYPTPDSYGTPYSSPYGTPYGTPAQSTPTPTATPVPTASPYNSPYSTPVYGTPTYPSPQVNVTVSAPAASPTTTITTRTAAQLRTSTISGQVLGVSTPSATENNQATEEPEIQEDNSQEISLLQLGIGITATLFLALASNFLFVKLLKR
jgi:hypothetical protein